MLQQHLRLRVKGRKDNASNLMYHLTHMHSHANHHDTCCVCVDVLSLNRGGTYDSSAATCVVTVMFVDLTRSGFRMAYMTGSGVCVCVCPR